MNMTGTLIGICIIAVLVLITVLIAKDNIKAKKEIREFEEKADKAMENAETLVKHEEKSNEIKEKQSETVKEINNAKTKEDLIAIANGIADANNDKLRKQGQKGKDNSTSTGTGKTRTSKTNRK